MDFREGTRPDEHAVAGGPRRVAVFIDYWWVYSSARLLFGGGQPPAWFGNVSPAELARVLVKRPPAASRRSERSGAGVHLFIRSYDPVMHHGQHERVQRWSAGGATVDVGPAREEGGAFWQSSVSVALACSVVEALATGACDTAVVFAGDAALLPLFSRAAGADQPSTRLELATWVGPTGAVPTTLATAPGVWCHRLGETTFKQVSDDRRPARAAAARQRRAATAEQHRQAAPPHKGATPATAMAAAFAAAVVERQAPGRPPESASAASEPTHHEPAPPPAEPAADDHESGSGGTVRRITQRLFGRGA